MKVVYVAGPLIAGDHWQIRLNIQAAAAVGLEVAKAGACPVIPHTNTGSVFIGTITDDFWYDATRELLRRCDAMVVLPGYETSKGTMSEVAEAARRGMPIFRHDEIEMLRDWIGGREWFGRQL